MTGLSTGISQHRGYSSRNNVGIGWKYTFGK